MFLQLATLQIEPFIMSIIPYSNVGMFTNPKLMATYRFVFFLRLPELASFESAEAALNLIARVKAQDTSDPLDKLSNMISELL